MHSFCQPSGQPPTPSITPKSDSFSNEIERTPQFESSFYDPGWSPAAPNATSPAAFQTPRLFKITTSARGSPGPRGLKRSFVDSDQLGEADTEFKHLPPADSLDSLTTDPLRRLSVSPLPRIDKARNTKGHASKSRTPLKLDTQSSLTSSMQSASSIQTPPPTSSSTSKRRAQEMQDLRALRTPEKGGANGHSPTKGGAPFSAITEASPQPFGNLGFSPDVLDFTNTGPATAPAYTQNKILWDSNADTNAMNIDFSGGDLFSNAFATGESSNLDSLLITPKQAVIPHNLESSFAHDDSMIGLSSNNSQQAIYLSNHGLNTSPGKQFGGAVDPSLLFSSPSGPVHHPTQTFGTDHPIDDLLQPYAHQIHEARREKDDGSQRPAKRRKKPKTDSPAVKLALQTLKGDNISSASSKLSSSSQSVVEDDSNRAAFPPPPRDEVRPRPRVAPGQQHHQRLPQTGSRLHRRTSVRLEIDADGRAQTKTEIIRDKKRPTSRSSSSDESDEEPSEEEQRTINASFNQSFGISKLGLSQPKLARFSVDPRSHSQKSSYQSTVGPTRRSSMQSSSQRFRGSTPQKTHGKRSLPSDQMSSSATISEMGSHSRASDSATEPMIDSDDDNGGIDHGNAQHELKKILRSRSKRRSQTLGVKSGQQFGPEISRAYHNAPLSAYAGYENISPTTITDPDAITPRTAVSQQNQVEGLTRCVCHSHGRDGEAMILW